jgi:TRAP-type C4-dicarboxylate transport system permease small subunit
VNVIIKLEHALVKIESIIGAFSLFLMLALSIFQIITRDFFDFGYAEIEIINRNLLIICGAMGAVLATSKLRHIKIDALAVLFDDRRLSQLCRPLALFSATVCALMCYYSCIFLMDEWEYAPANERWSLPFTLIYPVGFGLLSLHFALNCVQKKQ